MSPDTRPTGAISHPLFLLFLLVLAASITLLLTIAAAPVAALLGFSMSAGAFAIAVFRVMGRASPDQLRHLAARNDAGRVLLLAITTILILVVLVVVGLELAAKGRASTPDILLAMISLSSAWLFGSLVYAIHYTHMFYDREVIGGDHGGLAFPGTPAPCFSDFCYFAFVLGMTFQVSDVQITSRKIRVAATVHGLVAFFFNIGILALVVNLVAGSIATR